MVNKNIRFGLMGLYGPAIVMLFWLAIVELNAAEKLLTIALLLLSLDLLKMAIFDLEQVALVRSSPPTPNSGGADPRLVWFWRVTIVTIVFELLGLYGAWFSLSWGAIVVLLSQVGFNLFAQVQLLPDQSEMIQSFGIRDRAIVLVADVLGILLVTIGAFGFWPVETSAGVLGMVVIYGVIKFAQEK